MNRGSDAPVGKLLATIKEPLRLTPHRLLDRLSAEPDVKQAILGKPVPKPEEQFRLAVLHPSEPKVVFVCNHGVIVVQDISEPDAKPVKLVTSRTKPLAYGSFSGDGHFFAVGDSEGGIVIFETKTWKETKSFVKGTAAIMQVCLNKTGDKLIADTETGLVLWDVAGNAEIAVVGERYVFGGAFCFSGDQVHCATGGLNRVNIDDVKTGKKVREIGHATHPMQLCFSSDGKLIASGLRGVPFNKHVSVFDVATGKTVIDRAEHGKGITGVAFLDDDKCLLSTAADGTMKFWHVPSGTELLRMKLADSIYQPSCHVNGSTILWNQKSGPRYFSFK
jgi:WD40 repeat protein